METLQKQLLSGYQPIPGIHDEFLQNGQIRSHYDFLISSLDSLGTDRLQQRRNEAHRLLKENGVTYSIYGSPSGENRIWPLDLIPVIIPSDEWSPLERGLIQRAELLDLVLTDLYNQRTAIHEKLIPADLLFRSRAFLRPCHDLFPPRTSALSYFATDVSRNADGSFVALGDRIQAPSGSGYSLENRIVLSRVLPSIYRDSQVHRLATYFRTLRRNMIRRAQIRKKDPLTILLTPGPANETYFEHAYLASYLGFTLAQADDLTVREQRLYLKTVEGFQQVDIVFRRIDDAFLDSLELRGDSLLGIPGLLQCIRAGTVTVLNPPGCGILEDRSLLAYLPELSRHFLGEDLILPNARTYWLGDENHLNQVRHRTDIAIKPAIRRRGEEGYFLEYMSDSDREYLWSRILERPYDFIAQEVLSGCSCPVFQNGQFTPARGIYRTFIAAADSGYVVLPGGLARFSVTPDNFIITNQAGALSKDIWILASEPQKQETLLSVPADATEIFRKGIGLPGRVADNLFWLARYAERAENQCRFLRMIVESSDDGNSVTALQGTLSGILTGLAGSSGPQYSEDLVSFMLVRTGDEGSMAHDLQALVQSGRRIRDRLSEDTRRVISGLESTLNSLQEDDIVEASEALFQIILLLTSLTGHLSENMSREASYFFPGFGKRLERSLFLLRLIYSLSRTASLEWWDLLDAILRINDISITYRRRYRNRMDVRSVLDILLFDRTNPRSLIFQVDEMYSMSATLPGVENPDKSRERKLALELYTRVHLTEIESLIGSDGALLIDKLQDFSLECQRLTHDLSDAVSDRYFQYREQSQQMEDLGA
ncbi:MAG: carboxylate--amine ligase [Spirochaetaceae bacterium]|nr:carboxylate--amine ligase [Spirochaetaceae bacterium]|tara:strand:+ start:10478 stop:12955 length:2478 start_codon:yes stop_codon:yes gene_type:complete